MQIRRQKIFQTQLSEYRQRLQLAVVVSAHAPSGLWFGAVHEGAIQIGGDLVDRATRTCGKCGRERKRCAVVRRELGRGAVNIRGDRSSDGACSSGANRPEADRGQVM